MTNSGEESIGSFKTHRFSQYPAPMSQGRGTALSSTQLTQLPY